MKINKYIDKVERYKQKTLEKALEKLKAEYKEARDSYSCTGYDRYYNKMSRCEKQIEEINEYLGSRNDAKEELTASEYKELLELRQAMKNIKSKVFYLSKELPVCADLINLQDILRDY